MKNKDKEKKEQEEKEEREEQEKKEKKQLTPEDLIGFIEELKERFDIDDANIRIVKIERRKPNWKEVLLFLLFTYLLDFVLIIALNGYLGFAPYDLFRLFLFSVIFTTTDILGRELMMRYFPKLMFYSFGTIVFPISTAALIFAWWVTPDLAINSFNNLIAFFIIFMIARVLINFLIMRIYRDKMFEKISGGKQ